MQTPIKETFTGIGQIFLQENGLTGLVITVAMFFSHWTLGVACFLGSLVGTLTARALKYPIRQIQQGLFGFNSSLAFMCVMFTFPFVLTCWLLCFLTAKFQLFSLEQTTPELSDYTDTFNAIQSPLYAWAEVNFGSSVITGRGLFVAIAISSPMAAMYGMAAAVLGTAFAHHLLAVGPNNLANGLYGLYGFSPILVACAFAGERLCHFFIS